MKKFAKILGFLGFFVTLATAQIGTAWAAGAVRCEAGYYLPAGSAECEECPGTVSVSGTNVGVYCLGSGEQEWIPGESAQGLWYCNDDKACGDSSNWEYTREGAKSAADCNGGPMNGCSCHHPNDFCPDGFTCGYNRNFTVTGTNFCGSCVIDEENTNTWCPLTCPKSCDNGTCTCPGDDCTGYDEVNNLPGVHYCGTAANACDVTHLIQGENTSNAQIVEVNPLNYQCSAYGECKVECSHDGNPNCPNGTTCEWNPNSPSPVLGYLDDQNKCRDYSTGNIIENFACDIVITGCADQCQYWDETLKTCVTYQSDTYYKCGGQSAVQGPDAVCGDPYTINRTTDQGTTKIIDTSTCAPAGYRFQGWKLTIDYSPYNGNIYTDPDVPDYNRFERWQATTNDAATFEAQWEEDKLYVHYNRYGGTWVQSNPPVDDKEAFTISELPLTKTWTLSRDNSTFRGWCDDLYYSHLSDTTWLNAHCHSPYTIPTGTTSDVYLYAWWECTGPYTLNSDYQCEGDKIDVKYTCHAPENSSYNDTSYTYNNAATYGQEYGPVKSVEEVTAAPHSTACQFAGYEIDPQLGNNYQWILKNWNYNTGGKYSPGGTMAANDWQHISPTPETEIELELEPNVWKAKKYKVEYHCGEIKPGADVYTDSSATYGQTYSVAGQFDPIDGNAVTVQEFLDTNCKPDGEGGFGAWTFQYWTFVCPNYPEDTNHYATGQNFGTWTYDSNDCYFTANWAQTDFVIILDQNGATNESNPTQLYTRLNRGVYLDSARRQQMLFDSNPIELPKKNVTAELYPNGNGASFVFNGVTYPNDNNTYASSSVELSFGGFYETAENSDLFINGETGFITELGDADGRRAIENKTWYAHWGTGTITLPSTATWGGHDFAGWKCIDAEGNTIYTWTPGNDSTPAVPGISENITCTAQWSVACRSVSFDENGGTSTGGGNNGKFWKISDQTGWYADSTCTSSVNPNIAGSRPTKENATFIGYDDTDSTPAVRIFDNLGAVTTSGQSWTISNNATLYAQYECDDLYYLNPQTGSCEMCPAGSFYDSDTGSCKTCNEILQPLTGISGWISKEGYTWSIDQCYRNCGTDGNDNVDGCDAVTTPSGHGFEQFVTISGGVGRQISFYGNEREGIYTCRSATGATKCPLGLLDSENTSGLGGGNRPMAAAVKFNNIADGETPQRYIIGNRAGGDSLSLVDGFAWSQVVGAGQQGPEITNTIGGSPETYRYTFITYPADTAPAAISREHQTFVGYGYPETGESQLVDASNLTADNANGIIRFAKNLNPAQNNMSPNTQLPYSRNLWPIYTDDPKYTLTYSCGQGGGTPSISPNPVENIYAGNRIVPAQPEGCTNYGNVQFKWWAVSNSADTHLAGDAGAFEWAYTENKTFTAVWGNANTHSIIYNKIPTTNGNNITPNGNTLVRPNASTMPTQFECDNGTTDITGQPQLKNSDDVVIGTVVAWCDDNGLSESCVDMPGTKTISHTPCTDKNVYAKWECKDESGYHLNESKDDCVPCPDNTVWNGSACVPAETLCPEGYPYTRSPYNWDINNCFKYCDKPCEDISINGTYIFDATAKQIAFYGNERNGEPSVCDIDDAKYCPRVLWPRVESFSPKESLVTFKKMGNDGNAGTRYIVGNTHDANNGYFNNSPKWWSYIVGAGQKNPEEFGGYTLVIYPTDTAPNPGDTGAQFKGYYDGTGSNATQRVAAELGLDSTNAVAFPQSQLSENQIGDRILYPQYCANGETWNGQSCGGSTYTVKYVCGTHGTNVDGMSMENTATYGQSYKVAYSGAQKIAECNPNTGYVLKTNNNNKPVWKFNGNDTEYFTGEEFQWNSTISGPTFTAQYDCDRGYTWNTEHTACVPISGTACPAELSEGSHASMIGEPTINNNDECVYTIQCHSCVNNTNSYACYIHTNPGSNANGQFTITGNQYDSTVLNGVSCTPADFCVTLNDNGGNGGIGKLCEIYGEGWHKYGSDRMISSLESNDLPTWLNNSQVFAGYWTLQNDGSIEIDSEGLIVANNTILEDNNQTWYAHWGDGTGYTVTFKCDGDTQWTETLTVYPTQDINVPQTQCLRTGYTFTNWVDTPHNVTIPATNQTFNWTGEFNSVLTPDWTANTYRVTYKCDENDDTGVTDPTAAVYDQNYYVQPYDGGDVVRCTPPAGKVFTEWSLNTTPNATGMQPGNTTWTYDISDPTFTAQWTDGCHKVYLDNQVSSFGGIDPTGYTSPYVMFYIHDGSWYIDNECRRSVSPYINVLPTKTNATFLGYDIDQTPGNSLQTPVFYATIQSGVLVGAYLNPEYNTWTITGDTTLYAKYDCDDGYTLNGTTCVLDSSNFHTITLDKNVDNLHGDDSIPTLLYTIEGSRTVYKNAGHTEPFRQLDENPKKYAYVTFHFCDGDNNSCERPSTEDVTKNAYFTFDGFYVQHSDESERYIYSNGMFSQLGGLVASEYEDNRTWYAVWNDYGTVSQSDWQANPTPPSGYAFGRWYTKPECAEDLVTANYHFTEDKNVYACWQQNASELCPAQLPTNAHASLVDTPTISNNQCTYKIQCNSCIGENSAYDCYVYNNGNINSANTDGIFTITGLTNDNTVLNNVRCEPATYNAVYKCGAGTPGGSYTDNVTITYNGSYTVLSNGTENGGVVTCSKDGERFNHWTFNLESGRQYTGGEQISPWLYHGATVPTFTAQYGQCPEGEVLVDGECKPICTKNCIYPGANPGACPSNYPINAICAYDSSSNPVIGYRPSPYSNKCLDVDYPHDPVVANQCDVTEVTCPIHYEWNPVTLKCDPKIYQVRLEANGGTTSFGFVSKLFEKYNEGWGKNETGSFIPNLQLSSSELPTGADISQVFTGYGINCNSTARMISADGTVLASPTTLVDNTQTWYACYGPNTDATFTIKFRCSANGQDIYVHNVHVGESINVPATGVCPGVAFNQWKSTLNQPVITLPAGAISVQWNHYFDEVFVPDTKAVYHVDLNANGGTFPSNDYQQLWYAVDMGWYKDEALTQPISNGTMLSSYLPTNQGSSFNGWFTDPISGEQRGNMISSGWRLPNSISTDEEWWAHWGQCALGEFWVDGECKKCSEATYGQYPLSDAGATSVTQCYKPCSICLNSGCPTAHGANCVYNSNDPSVQNNGKNYNNGIDTCVPNSTPAPNCPYMITDCNEPGWIPAQDGQSCVEDEKHTITLDAHIIHGVGSDPDVLYTWHNRGVYLYSDYTGEMTLNQNPLNENPLNYAIVTFNLNGQGASLVWNGQTYTGTMNANVLFDYQGFWKSVNGSPRYIDIDGHINGNGRSVGMAATDDLTWHARWQPRTLGTVSQSGNDLPQPTRPGYSFDGWYDLPVGGNQVYSSSLVNNDMTVYARWSDRIYTVNLVSDKNNCQPSSNTPTKLFEKYNVGWNRDTTGRFDLNLNLTDDELPTPNAGYIFDGYYDAQSGGQRVIRSDGRVIQEPNYTDDTHTWYARCVRPNGPFTVTFKCDTDGHNVQSGSVNYGANVTAPTVADANCTKPGHTFSKWKAVVNNENVVFSAGETYSWGYYSGADFVPQWVLDAPYHVTLDQNGATQPGVTDLYEKYGLWWSQYQSGNPAIPQLSGNALPRKTGSNFRGYQNESGDWMGTYNSTTGVWRLPSNTTVTSDETWTAQWDNCVDGEYWLNGICESCSKQTNGEYTHSDPGATSVTQCYKECDWSCTQNGCPGTQPAGMSSCTYGNVSGNGIQYNVSGATCQLQGQPNFPQNSCQACTDCCPMNITCDKGYDLVGCECRDNRYTITLDSNLYNDNGTLANPSTLYTWFNHGVYRDFARTLEMTPNENPLAVETPSTFATVTLNGNGAYFDWHNQYGPQLEDKVDFVFDGFYDTTGAATDPVIGINRYITEAGQSIGKTAQNNQTWRASWRNGSVDLPSISRDGYTFDGWWTECNGGTRVSMGDQTITVSGDRTLCAHWVNKSYTVTYNCDSEGGQGGTATDSQLAYQNTTYTVLGNFIPCHKDANVSNGTRYHEFENWKFNLNSNSYWPGDSIMWIFNEDNPIFNAHYKECPNGWYFDGSCKQCPNGYTNSDIDADSASKCYKTCDVPCTRPTSQCPMNEEGVLTCTYPNNTYPLGKQYSGSDDCIYKEEDVPLCEPFTIMCKPGYTPDYYLSTDTGTHCTKLADHEITLAANCGQGTVIPGNQEKLYTTENTGVYLDPARTNTYQMGLRRNPLESGDWARCIVTATFNHCDNNDPNCDGATIEQKTVDLGFNGYYKAETNGTRYTDTRQEDGQLKSYITQQGIDAGKGYNANATWFAQWSDGQVGLQKWPSAPTRIGTCGVTYEFVAWYTAANGGTVVSPATPINSNVTWYAHWCESCPTGTIDHGSCTAQNCKAEFKCDDGYDWNSGSCTCTPTTELTLTYQPNGGVARNGVELVQQMTFGQSFTTLGGNDITMAGNINCKWDTVSGGQFPLLDHEYTYNQNGNTVLKAHWTACTCDAGNGVQSCSTNVVDNTCVPTVTCQGGYVPVTPYGISGECSNKVAVSCTKCSAGYYQNGTQCSPCDGDTVSAAGATVCEQCATGYTANAEHTQCVGNPITIDWDENGGQSVNNGSCQFCTNGCDGITCESCDAHPDNMLTLANAPEHSNRAMQFLGWKLFRGDSNHPAGTNVMCTYDNVGVYSGTSREIKAQWNECQCNYSEEDHVLWCQPTYTSGSCMCFAKCEDGYKLIDDTYTCNPSCIPETYSEGITYKPNGGTPNRNYTQSVAYNATFTTFGWSAEHYTKAHHILAGWAVESGGVGTFDGTAALNETYTYHTDGPTSLLAKWTECANDEISFSTDNECHQCTCDAPNCNTYATDENKCACDATCPTGYTYDGCNCSGTVCEPICNKKQSDAIYVCGDDAMGTPPATQTMSYGDTHTVQSPFQPQGNCSKPNHTFMTWLFSGDGNYHNPGDAIVWNYTEDKTFTGKWCETCVQPSHGSCEGPYFAGSCSYDCSCEPGYRLVGGICTAHPVCEPDDSLTITYRPNGGMNNGVLGQPVIQNVTYGAGFITKPGTIFTKENSIITAWDHVEGGDYPELNRWYVYDTDIDTILDAHWEQCTCTLGTGAESCGTLSTAGNACNWTNPVCQNGYVSPNMQCSGTGNTNCTLTCGECAEGEIIVDGQCVPCTCTTGTGAASCTPGATANNTCTAVGQCLVGYGNDNGNANVVCSDTNCVVSYNKCDDGWVSNENCQCNECPANTYQSGNTCVDCPTGYTSPSGSSSADACVPGAHTIHYLSNNGLNQTYDQSVTYGQSFMTEGGTRFTKTNHIMTHWNVESGPSNTFTNGAATLSGNYVYNDTDDTTLSAQWAQCTCNAGTGVANCETYSNANACDATVTCEPGYSNPQLNCNGTTCTATCTLGGSNAVYKCGTGIGTGYSTYVNYGDIHTILTNAFVGCYRDNSTFAGWAFNGDNNMYFDNVGATVTWNYTAPKEFEAKWCDNCSVVEHGTNQLTIPEPGLCRCDLTCYTGYHVENGTCEPNVYPNENGITYKPNGGTPNRNYTQSVIYDAPFTTLGAVYSKARHILNSWDVESGGAGTFNGTAALNTTYTYHTDGATSLLAEWIECGINEISLDNQCQQCRCTDNNAGVTSCETSATNNDTCSCSGECAAGYINAGCNCNGTNCTQSCTKCADNQVSVNNACENCVCEKNIDGIEGIISGCGFVSNNGNTCNWNPTTCRLGYGYPDLTCTETEHNNNCTASCTICPAGTYGDNGVECKPCPEGKTSLAGATSIRECFIDPNSCGPDEHIEHGECTPNVRACSIPDATSAVRIWNPAIGTYGPCTVEVDGCNSGYHVSGNVCVKDTEACTVEHGHGEHDWNGTSWGACGDVVCDPGYEPNSDYTACVECSNRRVNGDVAVSSYVSECEIAACMYQGQKYALQNGECVPICENASDETGTKVWDERTKKCIRTCNPGYKMW